MVKILGDFIERFPPRCDALELSFSPPTAVVSARDPRRWRNNLLSANFVAEYCTNFLPYPGSEQAREQETHQQRIQDLKGAIGYVANELLENAVKFNLNSAQPTVKLGIHFLKEPKLVAVMFASNSIDKQRAESFQTFIHTLLGVDTKELYFRRLEANTITDVAPTSGLGFLTMMNDYQARLGWRFESVSDGVHNSSVHPRTQKDEIVMVTSMAQIMV